MRADPETEREVFAAVDAFFDHIAHSRADAALASFAPDADIALYGSEASEVVIGPDALRAFLAKLLNGPVGPRFKFLQRSASVSGRVAWFTAEAEVAIGAEVLAPYRLTGVLEKRRGRWLWMLFNGSEPRPDRT
jgi:ketosteroid isomerase-like protein